MQKRNYILWLMTLAGWLLIGSTWTLNYYIFAHQYVAIFTVQPTLVQMMVWELPYWFIWAGLSPLVYLVTNRYPPEARHWFRNGVVHVLACLGLSMLHRAIYLILGWAIHVAVYQRLATLPRLYNFLFFFNLPTGFMCYATIVLVSYLVMYQRRYREEELKATQFEARLAQSELQGARARLDALKMQLQPHFLFNTLNSISSLLDYNPEAADRMLSRLADFLRMTLRDSSVQTTSLAEEIEFLKCYLDIERFRFEDRLDFRLSISPEALKAEVPSLMLQPIVENAIKYAIAPSDQPGWIEVRAAKSAERLVIQVGDSGCIVNGKVTAYREPKDGLGISNTRARLQQLYPDDHRFLIAGNWAGGVSVTIDLPFTAAPSLTVPRRPAELQAIK